MIVGEKVQAWSDEKHICLGWGKIIKIVYSIVDQADKGFIFKKEGVPLIQLESGKIIWGDRCYWITEKKAIEIGLNVWLKTMGENFKKKGL